MSRVRWAVRESSAGEWSTFAHRANAVLCVKCYDGRVVRVTQYDARETAARRAVIEAAKACSRVTPCSSVATAQKAFAHLNDVVDALEALERKEAAK